MSDSDQTARVRLTPVEGDLTVHVTLRDGRSTTRVIRDTAALLPTLEALLTLPTLPSAVGARAAPAVDDAAPPEIPRRDAQNPEARVDVEIGGGVGARVAGPGVYWSASPSIFAQARLGAWLAGLGMRWETLVKFTGAARQGFEADTIALELTLARRLPTSFALVDVGVSPRLVTQSQSVLEAGTEISGTSTDIRPGLFVRVAFGHRPLHFLVEADAGVSPSHLRRELRAIPESPRLPGWSAGLSVGALWGEP